MGKVISSPVSHFPGTVTLSDPLTLPQCAAWGEAVEEARGKRTLASMDAALLTGAFACVEAWNIQGVPEKPTLRTFPVKPHAARQELVAWLTREITELYRDDTDPNG